MCVDPMRGRAAPHDDHKGVTGGRTMATAACRGVARCIRIGKANVNKPAQLVLPARTRGH